MKQSIRSYLCFKLQHGFAITSTVIAVALFILAMTAIPAAHFIEKGNFDIRERASGQLCGGFAEPGSAHCNTDQCKQFTCDPGGSGNWLGPEGTGVCAAHPDCAGGDGGQPPGGGDGGGQPAGKCDGTIGWVTTSYELQCDYGGDGSVDLSAPTAQVTGGQASGYCKQLCESGGKPPGAECSPGQFECVAGTVFGRQCNEQGKWAGQHAMAECGYVPTSGGGQGCWVRSDGCQSQHLQNCEELDSYSTQNACLGDIQCYTTLDNCATRSHENCSKPGSYRTLTECHAQGCYVLSDGCVDRYPLNCEELDSYRYKSDCLAGLPSGGVSDEPAETAPSCPEDKCDLGSYICKADDKDWTKMRCERESVGECHWNQWVSDNCNEDQVCDSSTAQCDTVTTPAGTSTKCASVSDECDTIGALKCADSRFSPKKKQCAYEKLPNGCYRKTWLPSQSSSCGDNKLCIQTGSSTVCTPRSIPPQPAQEDSGPNVGEEPRSSDGRIAYNEYTSQFVNLWNMWTAECENNANYTKCRNIGQSIINPNNRMFAQCENNNADGFLSEYTECNIIKLRVHGNERMIRDRLRELFTEDVAVTSESKESSAPAKEPESTCPAEPFNIKCEKRVDSISTGISEYIGYRCVGDGDWQFNQELTDSVCNSGRACEDPDGIVCTEGGSYYCDNGIKYDEGRYNYECDSGLIDDLEAAMLQEEPKQGFFQRALEQSIAIINNLASIVGLGREEIEQKQQETKTINEIHGTDCSQRSNPNEYMQCVKVGDFDQYLTFVCQNDQWIYVERGSCNDPDIGCTSFDTRCNNNVQQACAANGVWHDDVDEEGNLITCDDFQTRQSSSQHGLAKMISPCSAFEEDVCNKASSCTWSGGQCVNSEDVAGQTGCWTIFQNSCVGPDEYVCEEQDSYGSAESCETALNSKLSLRQKLIKRFASSQIGQTIFTVFAGVSKEAKQAVAYKNERQDMLDELGDLIELCNNGDCDLELQQEITDKLQTINDFDAEFFGQCENQQLSQIACQTVFDIVVKQSNDFEKEQQEQYIKSIEEELTLEHGQLCSEDYPAEVTCNCEGFAIHPGERCLVQISQRFEGSDENVEIWYCNEDFVCGWYSISELVAMGRIEQAVGQLKSGAENDNLPEIFFGEVLAQDCETVYYGEDAINAVKEGDICVDEVMRYVDTFQDISPRQFLDSILAKDPTLTSNDALKIASCVGDVDDVQFDCFMDQFPEADIEDTREYWGLTWISNDLRVIMEGGPLPIPIKYDFSKSPRENLKDIGNLMVAKWYAGLDLVTLGSAGKMTEHAVNWRETCEEYGWSTECLQASVTPGIEGTFLAFDVLGLTGIPQAAAGAMSETLVAKALNRALSSIPFIGRFASLVDDVVEVGNDVTRFDDAIYGDIRFDPDAVPLVGGGSDEVFEHQLRGGRVIDDLPVNIMRSDDVFNNLLYPEDATRLGEYIGGGYWGEVWVDSDTNTVIKIFKHAEQDSNVAQLRLLTDLDGNAGLPKVKTVYKDELGRVVGFEMEEFSGSTLYDYFDPDVGRWLSADQAEELIAYVDELHEAGYLHGDLVGNPGNIMIKSDGSVGLLDPGVVGIFGS